MLSWMSGGGIHEVSSAEGCAVPEHRDRRLSARPVPGRIENYPCIGKVRPAQSSRQLPDGLVKSGFDGEHTSSNQRLMYTWAWASPQ
jgi:hypothetical protein